MIGVLAHAWEEDWELRHKVDFDGDHRLIRVNNGVTLLDVTVDLYSAWKEWVLVRDNAKFLQAMRPVGGDPTVGGLALGTTLFLMNGWRMQTWEGDHRLQVRGNLYTDEGDPAFLPTLGYSIVIEQQVTNLIDRLADLTASITTMYRTQVLQSGVSILTGSTSTRLLTTLTPLQDLYTGAFVAVTSGGVTAIRLVQGQSVDGVFLVEALPFTPGSGASLDVLTYNTSMGRIV